LIFARHRIQTISAWTTCRRIKYPTAAWLSKATTFNEHMPTKHEMFRILFDGQVIKIY